MSKRAGSLVTMREVMDNIGVDAARFFCNVNEIEGDVRSGSLATPLGRFAAPDLQDGPAVAAIRPQGIFIETGVQPATGRVIERHFLGEVDLVELMVEGLEEPIMARMRGGLSLNPGTEVGIRVNADDVLIFAKVAD